MKQLIYITLFLSAVICSCRAPKDLVYQNIQNFKLKDGGLAMDIRLYNPNKYTLKLKKADVQVYLNGARLGEMKVKGKYALTKLDTFSLPVVLNVDLKNVLPNAFQLLLKSDMNVKLTGTIKAGRHGLYVKVPINYEGKQDILSGMKW